jgi:hypothetical protein
MNIRKKILILAVISGTSLFSANMKEIGNLADKIKNTEDVIVKQELIIELNKEVEKLDAKGVIKAQAIIDAKLIPSK